MANFALTSEDMKEMQHAFQVFKESNDQAQLQIKAYGRENGLLREKVERLSKALDEIEVRNARKGGGLFSGGDEPVRVGGISQTESKRFFFGEVLRGKAEHATVQAKGLHLGSDPAGGYLAPLEFVAEMIQGTVEYSPIRSLANVRTTTRTGIQLPRKTAPVGAAWVAEQGSRSETANPSFGLATIQSHELYALTKVSKAEVEDSVFDLEAFLRAEFAEQFGLSEGAAFVDGTGIGQPEGMATSASVASTISGNASALTADGLISLYHDVKGIYAARGTWLLNRSTLKAVRTLKSGDGHYLWSAAGLGASALVPGMPPTILGRPYVECPDLDDVGAGTYPIIFGDIRRAYTILDRIALEVLTDPITSKATGAVEFSARRRVGGQVTLAEAIRKLKVAAA